MYGWFRNRRGETGEVDERENFFGGGWECSVQKGETSGVPNNILRHKRKTGPDPKRNTSTPRSVHWEGRSILVGRRGTVVVDPGPQSRVPVSPLTHCRYSISSLSFRLPSPLPLGQRLTPSPLRHCPVSTWPIGPDTKSTRWDRVKEVSLHQPYVWWVLTRKDFKIIPFSFVIYTTLH